MKKYILLIWVCIMFIGLGSSWTYNPNIFSSYVNESFPIGYQVNGTNGWYNTSVVNTNGAFAYHNVNTSAIQNGSLEIDISNGNPATIPFFTSSGTLYKNISLLDNDGIHYWFTYNGLGGGCGTAGHMEIRLDYRNGTTFQTLDTYDNVLVPWTERNIYLGNVTGQTNLRLAFHMTRGGNGCGSDSLDIDELYVTKYNHLLGNENLTFNTNLSYTRYLVVPQNTFLTNAFMNLTYPFGTNTYIYYNFSNSKNDSKGWANLSNFEGSPNFTTGLIGNAINLTLNNNLKSIDTPLLNMSGDKTINIWIKPSNHTVSSALLDFNNNFYIGRGNDGSISVAGFIQGNTVQTNINSTIFQWTMLTIAMNTTTTNIYFNGSLINSSTRGIFGGSNNFTLGTFQNGVSDYVGLIDEFNIFNYTLGQSQINYLYNNGLGNIPSNTSNINISIGGNIISSIEDVSNFSSVNLTERTDNFASFVNNYINTCTFISGYCNVPIDFNSNGLANLQYSGILFNDLGFIDNGISYSSPVTEAQTNTIIGNFTLGQIPDSIILNYNNTESTPSVSVSGHDYILTSSVVSPSVDSNININFHYVFTIGGINYTSNQRNQTVNNLLLSTSCSGNFTFLNISNYDEENLGAINGTVEYTLNLESTDSTISSLSGNITGYNLLLCSTSNLTDSYLNYNLQLRYYASGYVYETYNIQNTEITNVPINLNLYFLNNTVGTQFKINYVDFSYLTYPNAVIQIQRQYLPTNIYNIVELPKIDSTGQAIGSFNTNNIKYKLIVIDNGEILDTFENLFPTCQSVILGNCELNLRGAKTTTTSTTGDFTYTLVKSNTSITLTYIIPSGTPRNIQFLTNQNSRFLQNISTCDTSIYASGGTIICGYNATIGDSIISTQIINSDGSHLYGSVQISEDLSSFYLLNNYFIGFILVLTLALMFVSSGAMQTIVAVIGVVFMGLIFLIRGTDWITLTGSLGWLVVASIIIIYSISKKEERS